MYNLRCLFWKSNTVSWSHAGKQRLNLMSVFLSEICGIKSQVKAWIKTIMLLVSVLSEIDLSLVTACFLWRTENLMEIILRLPGPM